MDDIRFVAPIQMQKMRSGTHRSKNFREPSRRPPPRGTVQTYALNALLLEIIA